MPIAKQMSNRRFRFGGLRRSKISVLYNKSLSQISNILNIETSLLIKLLKRKSPYLNITESYIMSDYEAEIYKDFFIKLLRKQIRGTLVPCNTYNIVEHQITIFNYASNILNRRTS